ncbi:serine protease precursor [Bradyrhizobiaceae bacterium SG-6C]|nr:serine protease precursor [Bradyrhizobiaceae bacterium SG-6C]
MAVLRICEDVMIETAPGKRSFIRTRSSGRRLQLVVVAAAAVMLAAPEAFAQYSSMNMRTGPSINVGPRININPTIRPHIGYDGYDRVRLRPRPYIVRQYDDGPPAEYYDEPPPKFRKKQPSKNAGKKSGPVAAENTYVAKEVLIEVAGNPTDAQADELARRHRLTRVQSQNFALTNSTFFRWRINDKRSVDAVVRELVASGNVKAAQRNNIFKLQQGASSAAAKSEGDPLQYALGKMRLPEAHALSVGADVTVAVIDSGIDVTHPELAGVITGTFDALNNGEGPHPHGTSIAGVIAAHARLMGAAPSSHLLAIRAFGAQKGGAESTSFLILKSLDYALAKNAQIINMSFAGPHDPAIERGLAVAAAKGVVLVAAAGNAGAKSPPLYPATDTNVIAVSATDQSDQLFAQSNRGKYVAISAPGVDILSPAPDGKYQMSSGTSLSAAYVSGVIALMIARNPQMSSSDIRATLTSTARDLGPKGRDDQFGAGQADAFGAVSAVVPAPVAAASDDSSKR